MDSFGESMNPDKPDTVRSPDPNSLLASTINHISHRPFAEYKQSRSFESGPQDRQPAGIQRHRLDKTPQKGPDVLTILSIDNIHQYGSDVEKSYAASAVESLEGTCSLISEESQDNGETLAKSHPFMQFKEMAVNSVMEEFFLWKDKQRETNAEGAQHGLQDPLKLEQDLGDSC
jgi:hypothetical protein